MEKGPKPAAEIPERVGGTDQQIGEIDWSNDPGRRDWGANQDGPKMDRRKRFTIRLRDEWLEGGHSLSQLSDFCSAVQIVCDSSTGRDAR